MNIIQLREYLDTRIMNLKEECQSCELSDMPVLVSELLTLTEIRQKI